MKNQPDQSAKAAERRRLAEESLKRQGAKGAGLKSEADAARLLHELEVHQIELEMQSEELRTAHEAMLGREDRIQELKREVNEFCRKTGQPVRYPSQEEGPDKNQY